MGSPWAVAEAFAGTKLTSGYVVVNLWHKVVQLRLAAAPGGNGVLAEGCLYWRHG
jgi:hypothetical protein